MKRKDFLQLQWVKKSSPFKIPKLNSDLPPDLIAKKIAQIVENLNTDLKESNIDLLHPAPSAESHPISTAEIGNSLKVEPLTNTTVVSDEEIIPPSQAHIEENISSCSDDLLVVNTQPEDRDFLDSSQSGVILEQLFLKLSSPRPPSHLN